MNGANLSETNVYGNKAIHTAATYRQYEVMKVIFEQGKGNFTIDGQKYVFLKKNHATSTRSGQVIAFKGNSDKKNY